jgi:hypothetical protein
MEATQDFSNFMNQPNGVDKEFFDKIVSKNLNLFKEIEVLFNKRLDKQLKFEKDSKKKEDDLEKLREKREKETEDLQKKVFDEKIKRLKQEKSDFEKFQEFDYNKIIPKGIKNISNQNENVQNDKSSIFDFLKRINNLPETLLNKLKPQEKTTSEQKNFGEDIVRVSFHPEGVVILKKLLDPIYKALNANTDALDKLMKTLQPSGSGKGGFLELLLMGVLAILGGIVVAITSVLEKLRSFKNTLVDFVDDLIKLPEKIKKFLKLDDLADWMRLKWGKVVDTIKDVGYYIKSYFDEFITNPFKEKWASFIKKVKEIMNFDELADVAKAKELSNAQKAKGAFNFSGIWKRIEDFGTGVSNTWEKYVSTPFTNAFKSFENIYNEKIMPFFDDIAKILTKISESLKPLWTFLKETGDNIVKIFLDVVEVLKPFGNWMKPVLSIFKTLASFLVILDPLVAAGKTLFDVWNNENLNIFEKSIAVLTSAFFGLGDGIASLIGIVSEGATGIWNLLTGKGWKTENAVGKFMRGMTDDYSFGGMGAQMGKRVTMAFEDPNRLLTKDSIDMAERLKPKGEETERDAAERYYREENKGQLSDEDKEFLDKMFDEKGKRIQDKLLKPKSTSYDIIDRQTGDMYRSDPSDEILASKKGGILDKGVDDLKKIMSEVSNQLSLMNTNMMNNQNILINNNSTNVSSNNESKEYLFKSIYDVNLDKRSSWWKHARDYSATG